MKAAQLATQFPMFIITCLLGITPIAASAQPYTISPDGSEVTDQKTGLIWRRCAEGMVLSGGSCTGTATTFTHEAALQQATNQASSTGVAWRLPNVKELTSIADKTLINPAIDLTTFPGTPANFFWSSSPYVGNSAIAWSVTFSDGDVGFNYRTYASNVRLVR